MTKDNIARLAKEADIGGCWLAYEREFLERYTALVVKAYTQAADKAAAAHKVERDELRKVLGLAQNALELNVVGSEYRGQKTYEAIAAIREVMK